MINLAKTLPVLALGASLICLSAQNIRADELLVDRGLPTANLNNAAGSDRSNVAWSFGGGDDDYYLVGDTFTNTGTSAYDIDDIRLWTIGDTAPTDLSLFGGVDGSDLTVVSTTAAVTNALYSDSMSYQGTSGSFIPMQQLDFSVNIVLGVGQTYDFFAQGTTSYGDNDIYLSASNAALSGSPQAGADNTLLYALVSGGSITAGDIGTWDSNGNGWDKSSDVNVQVFGATPDAASTMILFGFGLVGALAYRRSLKNA
jgi:hypothetical protein